MFEPTIINRLSLKNRFVRSATWEGMADGHGACTPKLTDLMVRLARGGVGLIITGHAYIDPAGQASPYQLGVANDHVIPALRALTDSVHSEDSKIILQLAHAGCQAMQKFTGCEPAGPSAITLDGKPFCREMTLDEIRYAVKAFGEAAYRAKRAGFDGVQIHAAHSYLLNQFLSPFYNKRKDDYGGCFENRARIVLNVYREIRNAVGNEFAILIKLNSDDFLDNGFRINEMINLSELLQKEGIDAIEMSGGSIQSEKQFRPVRPGGIESEEDEVYYRTSAAMYKKTITVPLMLVGGIRSYRVAEKLVKDGITDYISMSRPFIHDPDLINRWRSGDYIKSACRSDNTCYRPGIKGQGIYCMVKAKEQKNGR